MINLNKLRKLPSLPISDYIFFAACFLAFSIPLTGGKVVIPTLLLFILWLFEGRYAEKIQLLSQSKLFLLLVFFLFFNLLSFFWTDHFEPALRSLNPFNYYLLIIPVILTSISKEKVFFLIEAFVYGMFMHLILAFLGEYTSWIPNDKFYFPYAVYAAFTAFCALFFLNRFFMSDKNNKFCYVYLLLFLILVIFLFTHEGRSAQISFAITFLLYMFLIQKHLLKTLLSAIALIVTTGVLITYFSPTLSSHYQNGYTEIKNLIIDQKFDGSWGWRAGAWVTSTHVIAAEPFVGTGLGDSRDVYQRIIERGTSQQLYNVMWMDGPHNQYLAFLMKVGIIGTFPFLLLLFLFYRLSIQNRELKYLSIIFITLSCVNMMFDDILYMKPYNNYFALMLAIFILSAESEKHRPA